jgi:imidazolonepropionase-like amidohydrolase
MRLIPGILLTLLPLATLAESTAFINVAVLPMTGEEILANRTVIVTDGRIAAIGDVSTTVVPDDASVVDGTDRYLMPGLAEMHGHVTGTSAAELDRLFGLYLANGVTTVRGMLGRPSHLELRRRLEEGGILGPRLVTSGPSFNGGSVDGPTQAAAMVRDQHAAGYDFLKIHPGLTRAEFTAIAETANALGIPFAGHVPSDVGVAAALEAGIATIDHLDGYMEALIPPDRDPTGGVGGFFGLLLAGIADDSRIGELVERTVNAGTWNVPTESLFEHTTNDVAAADIGAWPEMKYVPRSTVENWIRAKNELLTERGFDRGIADRAIALRRELIRALHAAGAGLLLGSDSPQRFNVPGFSLHRELGYLVAAGLTPYEALRTGTVNPALFLDAYDERGSVEVGKIADLVLLDENPLQDIANARRVHGTMVRGRWVSRQMLDAMLKRAEIS